MLAYLNFISPASDWSHVVRPSSRRFSSVIYVAKESVVVVVSGVAFTWTTGVHSRMLLQPVVVQPGLTGGAPHPKLTWERVGPLRGRTSYDTSRRSVVPNLWVMTQIWVSGLCWVMR